MLKSDGARFSKKILVRLFWGKKGPKWPQNEVFWTFMKIESLYAMVWYGLSHYIFLIFGMKLGDNKG